MKALIIGGAGLLGTHLAPLLEKAGHEVALCDNFSGSLRIRTSNSYRIFTPNVTDLNATQHTFKAFQPEIVFLSVAYFFPRDVLYNFYDDVKLVLDSANVLSAVLPPSVKHVYFCSGYEVYGGPQTNKPLKETRKIKVSTNHHGTAELAAEKVIQFRCAEMRIPCTVLRIFDMYGPRVQFSARTGITSFLIDALLRDDPVGLVGAKRLRDFVHVEDVASAIMSIVKSGFEGVVNIGTGQGISLRDVMKVLVPLLKPSEYYEMPDTYIDSFSSVADTTVLRSLVKKNWTPKHNLIEDLPSLIEFREEELNFSTRSNPVTVLNALRGITSV